MPIPARSLFVSSAPTVSLLRRERFSQESDASCQATLARTVLGMLLHQDGSTTRLLETMAGCDLTVHVIEQERVHALPAQLKGILPGTSFLRRLTTLEARSNVLLDCVAFIAIETLPCEVASALEDGIHSIGQLLSQLWTRRVFREPDPEILAQLWATFSVPDPLAARSSLIVTPAGPCMVLAEVFRRGVLDMSR